MRSVALIFAALASPCFAEDSHLEKITTLVVQYTQLKSDAKKELAESLKLQGKQISLANPDSDSTGWFPLPDSPIIKGANTYTLLALNDDFGVLICKGSIPNPKVFVVKKFSLDGFKVGDEVPMIVGPHKLSAPVEFKGQKVTTFEPIPASISDVKALDSLKAFAGLNQKCGLKKREAIETIQEGLCEDVPRETRLKIVSLLDSFDLTPESVALLTVAADKGFRAKPITVVVPIPPEVPESDPKDARPLPVRKWAQAVSLRQQYQKQADEAKTAGHRKAYLSIKEDWAAKEKVLAVAVIKAREEANKEVKAKLIKQAEETWPVPKGTPTLQRAKIEAKRTTWINEQLKLATDKLAKDYAID